MATAAFSGLYKRLYKSKGLRAANILVRNSGIKGGEPCHFSFFYPSCRGSKNGTCCTCSRYSIGKNSNQDMGVFFAFCSS